ncbi:MAG TPA: caspase family protein [Blastocatellia bacterium]|nr:caspase family protein [Blastocatellia bacterium]
MQKKFPASCLATVLFAGLLLGPVARRTLPAARGQTDQRGLQVKPSQTLAKWPSREKRFGLIIGIDQYQDSQISKLEGASNDARKLADALVQFAGFPADQVTLLTSEQPLDKWPTRAKILSRLSILRSSVPPDGLLLVAFAGHGIERGKQAYLLPMDAQINADMALLEDTAINVDRMRNLIAETGVQQVVLIVDACRNDPAAGRGDSDNKLTETYVRGFNFKEHNKGISSFVTLYATKIGYRAYEYKEKKQGYFTWALVEALAGAAANDKGEVTLGGLVSYLQEVVPRRTRLELGDSKQQQPYALIEGYRADELIISVVSARTVAAAGAASKETRPGLPEPADMLRAAQTIFINSKSKWFKAAFVENDLRKRPEFKTLGLKLVNDRKNADIHVEIDRPLFTYTYTFKLIHPGSSLVLASGGVSEKGKSLQGSNAAVKVVDEIIKCLQDARTPPSTQPKEKQEPISSSL